MPRGLSSAGLALLASRRVRLRYLIEAEFSTGTLRLFTGLGTLSWDGRDWFGAAGLLQLGDDEITSERRTTVTSVLLTGIPTDARATDGRSLYELIAEADWRGRPLRRYLQLIDPDSGALRDTVLLSVRPMDTIEEADDGATLTFAVQAADLESRQESTDVRYYTAQDQRLHWPGDSGLDYVAAVQGLDIELRVG